MVIKTAKKKGNPNFVKGVQPAHLKGHDFAAHPERINKLGGRINTMKELRDKIQEMGAQEVEIIIEKGMKGKEDKTIKMTRVERLLFDWFTSSVWQKQQQLLQYGYGVPKQEIEVSGTLKTIHVTLKKKQDESSTNG